MLLRGATVMPRDYCRLLLDALCLIILLAVVVAHSPDGTCRVTVMPGEKAHWVCVTERGGA